MAGNSFSFVLKNGLYSERYRTLASCLPQPCALLPAKGSCTSILLRETGGREMHRSVNVRTGKQHRAGHRLCSIESGTRIRDQPTREVL